jgi:hypothetical protein
MSSVFFEDISDPLRDGRKDRTDHVDKMIAPRIKK